MTLVQLKHLIALADSGSFSKAAQALFLTQPALSRSIRALEDELHAPLFDRIGRRIELTPFGGETLKRARQLLFDADELQASGLTLEQAYTGPVTEQGFAPHADEPAPELLFVSDLTTLVKSIDGVQDVRALSLLRDGDGQHSSDPCGHANPVRGLRPDSRHACKCQRPPRLGGVG